MDSFLTGADFHKSYLFNRRTTATMQLKCEETLECLTSNPSSGLPGVVLAAFNSDGMFPRQLSGPHSHTIVGVFYSTAKGQLKQEKGEQIDLNSPFWGFSCSKLLTTIAVLQCVENRMIELDDPVDGILSELQDPSIIKSKPDGTFELLPAKNKITLRHLLTHTSGLSYDAMHPVLVAWRESRGESPMVMSGKAPEAYCVPLLFEPGTSWVYGAGLDWAGMLVERLNNTKLAAYMQRKLFKPLGLERSTFRPATRPDIMADLAQMWRRSDTGELTPIPSPFPLYARNDSGGMGLIASTSDFIAILKDLLKEKPALLEKESVMEMFTPQFEPGTPQHKGLVEQEVGSTFTIAFSVPS